jgi:hypothetical protein
MHLLDVERKHLSSEQGEHVVSSKDSGVFIQTSTQSVPSTPSWFGEVAVTAYYLRHVGVLATIEERVRFNAPCHPPLISHQHSAAWTKCVLLAIQDASGAKLSAPGPPYSRPIRTNGSARFRGHR